MKDFFCFFLFVFVKLTTVSHSLAWILQNTAGDATEANNSTISCCILTIILVFIERYAAFFVWVSVAVIHLEVLLFVALMPYSEKKWPFE